MRRDVELEYKGVTYTIPTTMDAFCRIESDGTVNVLKLLMLASQDYPPLSLCSMFLSKLLAQAGLNEPADQVLEHWVNSDNAAYYRHKVVEIASAMIPMTATEAQIKKPVKTGKKS